MSTIAELISRLRMHLVNNFYPSMTDTDIDNIEYQFKAYWSGDITWSELSENLDDLGYDTNHVMSDCFMTENDLEEVAQEEKYYRMINSINTLTEMGYKVTLSLDGEDVTYGEP